MSTHGDDDSLLACIDHWCEAGMYFAGSTCRDAATAKEDAETMRRGLVALGEVEALRAEVARLTGERDAEAEQARRLSGALVVAQEALEAMNASLAKARREADEARAGNTPSALAVQRAEQRELKALADLDEAVAERDALRLLVEGVARHRSALKAFWQSQEDNGNHVGVSGCNDEDRATAITLMNKDRDAVAACVAWEKEHGITAHADKPRCTCSYEDSEEMTRHAPLCALTKENR